MNQSYHTNIRKIIFKMTYAMFFISFFLNDIETTKFNFEIISSLLRYTTAAILCCSLITLKIYKKEIKVFFLAFILGLILFINTHATYFVIMSLLMLWGSRLNDREILEYNFKLLSLSTLLVLVLSGVGILKNIETHRWINDTSNARFALGFSHSNVLPLNFMYIVIYIILLKKERIRFLWLNLFLMIAVILYFICGSRNGFFITMGIVTFVYCIKSFGKSKIVESILHFISILIVPIFGLISITLPYFIDKSHVLQIIDELLTYRISHAKHVINIFGLNLFTIMNAQVYKEQARIVDSGYVLIALRYGIVLLILIAVLFSFLAKSLRNDAIVSISIIFVATVNFIDNDIFDYCCMPFMLIALNRVMIWGGRKVINITFKDNRMRNDRISISNYECL